MYNPDDEKLVVSFAEIKAMMDDPDYGLGYVDKAYLLPWVYPGNITGMNAEELVRFNRARHHNFANLPDIDESLAASLDEDAEGDDDEVAVYLYLAAQQRRALANSEGDVTPISGVRELAAMLYMMVHWESGVATSNVDRDDITIGEMQECLDLFVAAYHEAPLCHIKWIVIKEMELFFDADFSWVAKQVPVVEQFLEASRFSELRAQLERTFEAECPELAEYFERDRIRAEKAAAEARSKRINGVRLS